jgi:hypothetical protein
LAHHWRNDGLIAYQMVPSGAETSLSKQTKAVACVWTRASEGWFALAEIALSNWFWAASWERAKKQIADNRRLIVTREAGAGENHQIYLHI